MSSDPKIPKGRIQRFAQLASLGARTAGTLAKGQAKRALGGSSTGDETHAAMKVLETLGTMKGLAMKLGQQLAMDAEALPPEARAIVSKLFAQAPKASYDDIAGVVREELGAPPEVHFAEFEREPLASASLGQVHRAVTHQGDRVAVKVQYPGVAQALRADLDNVAVLMKVFGGATKAAAQLDPKPYYDEIRREIGAEADYQREAARGAAFAQAVRAFPELHVPRVLSAHSTGRVLTTELVEGLRLDEFVRQPLSDDERFRVGRLLALACFGPVLTAGLSHGDPHPGNFLVRPDGRLTVLDFGAVKQLDDAFVAPFWAILRGELRGEPVPLVPHFRAAGFTVRLPDDEAEAMLAALHVHAAAPLREPEYDWSQGAMLSGLRDYFRHHVRAVAAVQVPPSSLLFYRSLGGMAQNLQSLGAKGPFRQVCLELDAVRVQVERDKSFAAQSA